MRRFRFGAVVREAESGKAWAEKARRLEGAGFEVLLVPDHLVGPRFAPIAALTAAACATTRLRVGTLVFANDFRHPAVLAKETATLDVLSGGRLEVGIGTGWMAGDYAGAGLALEPPGVRVERLREALAVLKGLWGEGPFHFEGRHYRISGLDQRPKPLQRPRPPIVIGAGGARMVRLAAQEADVVNIGMRVRPDGSGPDLRDGGVRALLDKLAAVREAAGERYAALELGTSVIQAGERKAEEAWSAADSSALDETPQVLLGTRQDIVDKLRYWRDEHDLSYFVLHHERDLDAFEPVVEDLASG
ncbi:TIGR03621 family F420-dependent LLM class oxidoreductase [Nonomuraea gerenzanensis]|uniref:Luciferase-like n=1 Tax=Nonomuraea gerenzanensis TaxID=93944 RepID=A0A1M4E687_9ACTN|nr:TIGR03621 family F420-dependent LLM class oxidoreductase [Nonomuraea gerenzanensis]UBU16488.1 TIGR03621 family F420-dependent LLM class oxidoreductase [Nonomuraea gerenzanensis]SBO94310.1 luciferase-like [Nonomuraea gerenzanensis]